MRSAAFMLFFLHAYFGMSRIFQQVQNQASSYYALHQDNRAGENQTVLIHPTIHSGPWAQGSPVVWSCFARSQIHLLSCSFTKPSDLLSLQMSSQFSLKCHFSSHLEHCESVCYIFETLLYHRSQVPPPVCVCVHACVYAYMCVMYLQVEVNLRYCSSNAACLLFWDSISQKHRAYQLTRFAGRQAPALENAHGLLRMVFLIYRTQHIHTLFKFTF